MKSKRSKAWARRQKMFVITLLCAHDNDFAFECAVRGLDTMMQAHTLPQLRLYARMLPILLPVWGVVGCRQVGGSTRYNHTKTCP